MRVCDCRKKSKDNGERNNISYKRSATQLAVVFLPFEIGFSVVNVGYVFGDLVACGAIVDYGKNEIYRKLKPENNKNDKLCVQGFVLLVFVFIYKYSTEAGFCQ